MTRLLRHAVPLWSGLLTLLVCMPLLAAGYVLSYDMVWVPHLALTRADVWGLGSALPRAVPSDAFAGVLGSIIPAAIVQKVVLTGAILLASLGVGRLLREYPLIVQLAAMTMYVWNPFVAERLVLGHWPLLVAYAAIPWLISAMRSPDGVRRPAVTLALAATALTPATGLMGALIAFAVRGREQNFRLALQVLAVNAPWIVAGFIHSPIARSDGAAVSLFDLQPEGHFGHVGAALSLGGIWNIDVVPSSRGFVSAVIFAAVMWTVMVIGLSVLWQKDRRLLLGLSFSGAIGFALALSGWVAPEAMASLVGAVPGAGILRDGTRYLLLLAPIQAVTFGFGVHAVCGFVRALQMRQFVSVLALLIPIVALPDLAWGVGGALKTTEYPASWKAARVAIQTSNVAGDILVLPFSSYRKPEWNGGTPVLDPAGRFFDRETVTNDVLSVSGKEIVGEDPRAERIARFLDSPRPASALAKEGIGIVVVETDAGHVDERVFRGMTKIESGDGMNVFTVDKVEPRKGSAANRFAMIAAWTVAFLTLCLAGTKAIVKRLKR
ncbi:MAG: hypothetical protein ABIR57_04295 [Aeromicrobium sp.]